ncbi:MAG TPA: Tex-like N-terminal domain-containing protein, partial [Vicinamibacteria bacterium]
MPTPAHETWLATRVKDGPGEAALAAAKLLADGHTVPFLARYRQDETGGLDEAALRRVVAAREVFDRLEARRATILEAAERHKKRTPGLEERLGAASDLASLEDLALPFRKKKGETVLAREAGLEPLADWIWATGHGTETPQEGQTLDLWAFTFRNPEKGVAEAKDALAGAQALIVERLSEDPGLRAEVRRVVFAHGEVEAVKTEKAKAGSKHEAVLGLREKAMTLRESDHLHRVFGLRRAANEGEVKLRVVLPEGEESPRPGLEGAFAAAALSLPDAPGAAVLRAAAREALDEHVWPDMAAELLQSLREEADRTAIRPLAEGLRRRLLAPALGNRPVLGLHPTKDGGVVALVDAQGRFVKGDRFALADDQIAQARERLLGLAREGEVAAVAVGDGTAGRERAQFVEETLAGASLGTVVVQV